MGGEALAWDADLEVHHRLAAAQQPDRDVAHAFGQESEVVWCGRDDPGELRRQALRLAENGARPFWCGWRGQIAEAAALRQPVGAFGLLVDAVGASLAPSVVRQERPGNPLRPTWFPVLGPVANVHDAQQVTTAGLLVYAHQQFAEEEVLVRGSAEQSFEDVAPEKPPPCARGQAGGQEAVAHIASMAGRSCAEPHCLRRALCLRQPKQLTSARQLRPCPALPGRRTSAQVASSLPSQA